jgi:hypothetical protein
MDPIAAAGLAIKAGEKGYKAWSWWQRRRYGTVLIRHPQPSAPVKNGVLGVEGTHEKAKGHFWLVTTWNEQYWLQCEIQLRPDGIWKADINVGSDPIPRPCIILMVRVSAFAHSLFKDIQARSNRSKYYGPITLSRPPACQFKAAHALVVNVN